MKVELACEPKKTCGKCGATKPMSQFIKQSYSGVPTSPCKACRKAYSAEYRASHREQFREYQKRYQKSPKGKATNLRNVKRYQAAHRDEVRERNRAYRKREREKEKELRMQTECEYGFTKRGLGDSWFAKCSNCGKEFDGRVVKRHFVYCPNCGRFVANRERLVAK